MSKKKRVPKFVQAMLAQTRPIVGYAAEEIQATIARFR